MSFAVAFVCNRIRVSHFLIQVKSLDAIHESRTRLPGICKAPTKF